MSLQKRIQKQTERRTYRVKRRFMSKGLKPRITVFRSLSNIYAQIIDDSVHATLVDFSSIKLGAKKGDKKEIAKKVGLELGKLALDKGIKDVFFDRGSYLYHGRVQALAEGLRESGLNF